MEYHLSSLQKIVCFLIRLYQIILSPFIGQQCRFFPSCSEYTMEAVIVHGCIRGIYLGIKRIIRCQPLCCGGFDPIPSQDDK